MCVMMIAAPWEEDLLVVETKSGFTIGSAGRAGHTEQQQHCGVIHIGLFWTEIK
jgi:hypothetical protein